ncbi:MAG: hypothetical protein EP348_08370 [Alphaproteobacteria bacterium]|nr:MAG: hypothetical protein EP348_08370 [Alphaproteobacteria bacterium]
MAETENNDDSKDETAEAVDAMPTPPDLTSLFQKQTNDINTACQQAAQAFSVFKTRDSDVQTLAQTLSAEVQQVFTMAAAVKTPQMALASIPPVLLVANTAFATVPVTDQKTQGEIQQAFAPFTS